MTAGYQMDQQEIKQNSSTPNRMTTSNATDPITLDLSSKTSDVAMCDGDHSPGTVKDEDDEDDDDVDDRIDTQDPERLKAFNVTWHIFIHRILSSNTRYFVRFSFRCLFGYSSMKTSTAWCPFHDSPERKSRPLSVRIF
jgi:hypothetical protein